MSKKNNQKGLIVGLLGIAFVVLKLCKVIDWNWWYVTMPFWGGLAALIAFLIISFIVILFLPKKPEIEKPKPKSAFQAKLEEMEKLKAIAKNK